MPKSYADCYEHLKEAQAGMDSLGSKDRQERYAALRVAFFHLYQAANIAYMCCEASGFSDMATQRRDELNQFLGISQNCHELVDESDEEVRKICAYWIHRAKGYVEQTRTAESRVTNLQYARMPEAQDYSIICKDGKPWKEVGNGKAL